VNPDPRAWLFSLEHLGVKLGLDQMTKLLTALGNPHHRFPSVLVAGTNGKGSVTAMVDAALIAAGYRTARYTSPHLERLEERFVVSGREAPAADLDAALTRVRQAVENLTAVGEFATPPTFFECATAAAFRLFARASVDIATVEVGLGGRLDATNVLEPLVCAITTIDYDHEAQLGTTIEAIAAEKAGIIKPGTPVVIGRLPAEADAVVAGHAERAGAPLVRAHDTRLPAELLPGLAGAHQRDNAIVASTVLETLTTCGFSISEAARREGIADVRWPGRLERFTHNGRDVLIDAAHNPAGARALAAFIGDTGWMGAALVFAAMHDKDSRGMLSALAPVAGHIVCTTAPTDRASRAGDLAQVALECGASAVEVVEDPAAALDRACALSDRVVVAGSMFLIGPLRGILR
jgi:dihydrofolate synthase / folylpolyglutamate synthase